MWWMRFFKAIHFELDEKSRREKDKSSKGREEVRAGGKRKRTEKEDTSKSDGAAGRMGLRTRRTRMRTE
jgi:plasmid replication initiation protein